MTATLGTTTTTTTSTTTTTGTTTGTITITGTITSTSTTTGTATRPAQGFLLQPVRATLPRRGRLDRRRLEASREGVRALKISLFVLLGTTVLQFIVVLLSGSVALLADTVHNFSDALTAVPLWIAFILGRRVATRRYTYGFGRAEDLAGLFIIAVVALSAIVAAWQSIERLINPQPLHNLWWVVGAGFIGFAGNEAVAIHRIRVGRNIGSAALVADGVHARMDGFTSLAVVLGAFGAMLGFPIADPIVGLLISIAIVVLLWGTVRSIGRRLMDGIDPELLHKVERPRGHRSARRRAGAAALVGHRLQGAASITSTM